VAAIIYGFVRTDLTGKLSEHIYAPDLGPKLPSWVISGPGRAYLAYRAKSYDLTILTTSVSQNPLKALLSSKTAMKTAKKECGHEA